MGRFENLLSTCTRGAKTNDVYLTSVKKEKRNYFVLFSPISNVGPRVPPMNLKRNVFSVLPCNRFSKRFRSRATTTGTLYSIALCSRRGRTENVFRVVFVSPPPASYSAPGKTRRREKNKTVQILFRPVHYLSCCNENPLRRDRRPPARSFPLRFSRPADYP